MVRRALEAVPVQACGLALGCNGFAGLLTNWQRVGGWQLDPGPDFFAGCGVALASLYILKSLVLPGAFRADFSNVGGLSGIGALPAAVQALAVRYSSTLTIPVTQGIVICCWAFSIVVALQFLRVSYRQGIWPDPSWFPPTLLAGMTHITSRSVGPDFLRDWMEVQMLVLLGLWIPMMVVVTYRLLVSRVRDSVAPHAGMALLMAPSSFFAFTHLATGKPFGDPLGNGLMIASTGFFLVTLALLYSRRGLWANNFDLRYVAFTFPMASTSTAALLASERLPLFSTVPFRLWAAFLAVFCAVVVSFVLVRFFLVILPAMFGKAKGK